jgi:hypothetical protein
MITRVRCSTVSMIDCSVDQKLGLGLGRRSQCGDNAEQHRD